jgi:hypothetical protein
MKALAIIIKNDSVKRTIFYNELVENDLQYLNVKETPRRKMGTRNKPFFIDGNSKIQTLKGNDFIEYSFRNASRKDLEFVEKMRKKFGITAPHEFTGKVMHFEDDLMLED